MSLLTFLQPRKTLSKTFPRACEKSGLIVEVLLKRSDLLIIKILIHNLHSLAASMPETSINRINHTYFRSLEFNYIFEHILLWKEGVLSILPLNRNIRKELQISN